MNNLEQEKQIPAVSEWLKIRGLTRVLVDGDDTLWKTHAVFVKYVNEYLSAILGHVDKSVLDHYTLILSNEIVAAHKERSVHPSFWELVAAKMNEKYPHPGWIDKLGTIYQIYQTVPELHSGVTEALGVFKSAGAKIALVTHAEAGWTNKKVLGTGLAPYLDDICLINTNGPKGPFQWAKAIENLGVQSAACLAIGDNVGSDIDASFRAGANYRILVASDGWHENKKGEIPPNTMVVNNLPEIVVKILSGEFNYQHQPAERPVRLKLT